MRWAYRSRVTHAPRRPLGRNVIALGVVSLLTDVSSEIIYPLLPLFLTSVLGVGPGAIGAIEGAAETTAALLKLASGWWSDRVSRRKPLVVAGYALAAVARPLVAIAQSATQVLAIRLSDRVGKGIRSSPRDALIADSVDPSVRGRAFGFHRAMDHAGAVIGPLIAWGLLQREQLPLRTVFWVAAIPGLLSVVALVAFVRDVPRAAPSVATRASGGLKSDAKLGARFWSYLAIVMLFTLGNSSDAFLILRANQLGVPVALVPLLWAALHVVKSASSMPGGVVSDRIGRRTVIVAGWIVYALVYLAFGRASEAWQAWALFGAYGLYFGLTEGVERALVADIVPASRRGTAFGWYNLAVGLAALPASLLFGVVWERAGVTAAFTLGAAFAAVAAIGLAALVPERPRE